VTALDDEIRTLRARIAELEAADAERDRAERVQAALYRIAETASAAQDMGAFYAEMHRIVGELMYADNFYIVLYDEDRQVMNWPFYVDTVGEGWPDPNVWVPMGTGDARGITAYLLRTGIPLLLDFAGIDDLVRRGEVDMIGVPSVTWLGVPLRSEGRIVGAMVVQSFLDDIRHSERDRELLTFVASHVGSALSRARAIEETRQRNAELALINDVQRGLAENLEMQAMDDLVGDRLRDIFDAQVVSIDVLDEAEVLIRFPYIIEKGERLAAEPRPPEGFRKHILQTREPLLFHAITPDLLAEFQQPEVLVGERPKSSVWVPLIVSGRATGVVSLQNLDREHAFSELDVRLLTTLAGSLSVALENAKLFEETRQRNAELALINDVQRGLAEHLDAQAMYDLVGGRIQEIFDAQVVDIDILDPASGLIHFAYEIERGVRFHSDPMELIGFRRITAETRVPVIVNEDVEKRAAEAGNPLVISGEPAKSAIFVPLVIGDRATGVISLQNLDREHAFSQADVRLLMTLAGSLSVALENARLFEETRQRNAELALINDVQRGLAENLEMQAMYDLVGERLAQIFDAQTVDIGVVDGAAGQVWFPYSIERGERLIDHPIEIMGFRKIALETREPVVINEDMERRCIEAGNPLAIAGEPSRSSVFVPLLIGNRGSGVISLHNLDREHAFSDADVSLLTTLAGTLSVGLENARLFEETGQRAAELAIVNNVGQALAEQLELDR
jgi:GAF domain-containing protein